MAEPRRTRKRSISIDKQDLVTRALDFYDADEMARQEEMDLREQRYAKFRMWRGSGATQPWDDASDAALPDMMTDSLRVQDTLYNAVMSTRPCIISKATNEADEDKTKAVDRTIDYQAFVENGETWLSDAIDAFVNDGHFTLFIPWVKDKRKMSELYRLDEMPTEILPAEYFRAALAMHFGADAVVTPRGNPAKAWDYTVEEAPQEGKPAPEPIQVRFYTDEDNVVEMVVEREVVRYDGPKLICKDRSDVLHPPRVANLQIPGPSNPGGASHVILVDRPTLEEIDELVRRGFYDLISKEEMKDILATHEESDKTREEEQKDQIAGNTDSGKEPIRPHRSVTRLMVFDTLDIDGDGVLEDVVYWVLQEPGIACRIRRLSEMYPGPVPYRPFAEEQFIPVRGRRTGIGLLEIMEAGHDLKKVVTDQAVDHGTLMLSPFFFYRPTSSMKPEVIRLWPGEGYPVSDPSSDVNFPTIPNAGQAYAFNMLTMLQQWNERLTMVGELQLGRVPQGKASALRTAQGMSMVAQQGEARPERILRRFFCGLSQAWSCIHNLNRYFLSKEKQIRLSGFQEPGEDPYMTVERAAFETVVQFEFNANIFNTSRTALQESLAQIGQAIVSPIAMQLGMVDPNGIYRWHHDWIRAWGHEPENYIKPPMGAKPITWQEAIAEIMDNRLPKGFPLEGPQAHLMLLEEFAQSENIGHLTPEQVNLLFQWMQTVMMIMEQMAMMQQLAGAAGQGQPGQEGEGKPGPEGSGGDNSQAPLQANELQDETLPSAGGGANQGIQ